MLEIETKKLAETKAEIHRAIASKKYEIVLGIRPENTALADSSSPFRFKAKVESVELSGMDYHAFVRIEDQKAMVIVPSSVKVAPGDEIEMTFPLEKAHLFDEITEKAIDL